MTELRNRIVDAGVADPSTLVANPKNWRTHPEYQKRALEGVLEEIGWVTDVIVNRTTGNLVDGHLRVVLALEREENEIPVKYVELSEDEEEIILATLDPIGDLAGRDEDLIQSLLGGIEAESAELSSFLERMASEDFGDTGDDDSWYKDRTPAERAGNMAKNFLVPPFSILDSKQGRWLQRKREWIDLGIASELGRDDALIFNEGEAVSMGGRLHLTSIFDPVLTEVLVTWFSPAGGRLLDPFAGGSVRGIVSAALGREYVGVDLRPEQIEANEAQWETLREAFDLDPCWVLGDSTELDELLDDENEFDFMFSCPPYFDLEQYSDDPKDLSNMDYDEFLSAYETIIRNGYERLAENRFAAFVVGEVRDPDGAYRGFVADTVRAFERAGFKFYNELIFLQPIGSAPLRGTKYFKVARKVAKIHQNVLVFLKGDDREAVEALGDVEIFEGFEDEIAEEFGEVYVE